MTKYITYASCHDSFSTFSYKHPSGISHSTHEHTCIIQARRRTRWDPRSRRRSRSRNLWEDQIPERSCRGDKFSATASQTDSRETPPRITTRVLLAEAASVRADEPSLLLLQATSLDIHGYPSEPSRQLVLVEELMERISSIIYSMCHHSLVSSSLLRPC